MNLKKQHIGRLFTFLACLIILAHVAVPHHHHFELTHSSVQGPTCESSAQDKNTETPDSHCYAFNILVSGKTTNFSLNNSLSDYSSFYLPGIIASIETPPVKNLIVKVFDFQVIFLKQFFFTAHSLRGPPLYA